MGRVRESKYFREYWGWGAFVKGRCGRIELFLTYKVPMEP
jgi:hypothetical protein